MVINRARGLYRKNIRPRSGQYRPSAARSVQKCPRSNIFHVQTEQARLISRLLLAVFLAVSCSFSVSSSISCKSISSSSVVTEFARRILVVTHNLLFVLTYFI